MEKFALLNLIKAIDGLNSVKPAEKEEAKNPQEENLQPPENTPNVIMEALIRHEKISNRLKNRK